MGQEFTRQELYDLVWREPLRTLAKTLHISDVRLAKTPGYPQMSTNQAGTPWRDFPMKILIFQHALDFFGLLWKGIWWPRSESNQRHADFQSAALPTELLGHCNRLISFGCCTD